MDDKQWLAEKFEGNRAHLRGVAYRMLGSLSEADDAVQETWLRLNRSDTSGVQNLSGWLTTVVAHVCLDTLRARTSRREESMESQAVEPVAQRAAAMDPEQETLLAESVGLALLVVLDTLAPAERLAFVLQRLALAVVLGSPVGGDKHVRERGDPQCRAKNMPAQANIGGIWCWAR